MGHSVSSAVSSAVEKQLSAYLPGSSKDEQLHQETDLPDTPKSTAFKGHPAEDHSTVAKDHSHPSPYKEHKTAPGRFLNKAR
jgi:hypothetical protein